MPRLRLCLASLLATETLGQFGGGGYGGYDPPAPICPQFKCPAGEKAVGTPDYQYWSYGCKDSGVNFMNTASFDPNNPLGGMQSGKSVDRCCVERDICKQTCGMTSQACHDLFKKCSAKICKGDQNCNFQAQLSEMMSEPYDPDENKDEKYDPEKAKCKSYNKGQKASCKCVPKDEFTTATETTLKSFYRKFNKEKLDKDGEIKDVSEVWKKWKGKEPDMFLALGTKYKAKAVEIREKPKPPPYKPPPKDDNYESDYSSDYKQDYSSSASATGKSQDTSAPSSAESTVDKDDVAFARKLKDLKSAKAKAVEDEDYDKADEMKEEMATYRQKESERLSAKKKQALQDEDFLEAKRIKALMAKHEL